MTMITTNAPIDRPKKSNDAAGDKCVKLYPVIDKPEVRLFLNSKARNSAQTAKAYWEGIYRFDNFLRENYNNGLDVASVLKPLATKEIDLYKLFDQFITYLQMHEYTPASIHNFVAGVRSYVQYHDIDVIPAKFKHKVTMPKNRKEDEYALDREEIRKILTHIRQPRLKTYCILLACGGMRAVEALAIQVRDIDFDVQPTKIYMKAEYSKNKLPREVYITAEATQFLKVWLDHKYQGKSAPPDDLAFAVQDKSTPEGMYTTLALQFRYALRSVDLDDRKKGIHNRGKITLHSFRRYVETVIEDHTSANYASYILGHKKSVYFNKKEQERRAKYAECERYLTFLDYSGVDQQNKTLEGELLETRQRMDNLRRELDYYKATLGDPQELARQMLEIQHHLDAIKVHYERRGIQWSL
jgi:integrase